MQVPQREYPLVWLQEEHELLQLVEEMQSEYEDEYWYPEAQVWQEEEFEQLAQLIGQL